VDFGYRCSEFRFGIVVQPRGECSQYFFAVAASYGHYEGEAELVFVAAVEFVELFVFLGGALVYAGALLFLPGFWG
jgi:hypothetical protein